MNFVMQTSAILGIRDKLNRDEPLIVVNVDHPSSSLVEILSQQKIDIIFFDCEQGSIDCESVENMARAARLHNTVSIVRVFDSKEWVLSRYLLLGVDGLVVPRVDTVEDAKEIVDVVKYCFPMDHENKLIVIQIESCSAADKFEEFLAIDGIDIFFIGPVDLSKSMGYKGDFRVAEVEEKIDGIIKLARSAGRHVGILVDNENVEKYVNKGVRFLYTHLNAFLEKGANAFAERTKLNL